MLRPNPNFRRTLVHLYDDVDKIQVVSHEAGVDNKKIAWKKAAVVVWYEVIKECLKKKILPKLVENVRTDYPRNLDLIEYENKINGLPNELEKILLNIALDKSKIGLMDLVNSGRHQLSNDFWDPKQRDVESTLLLTGVISGEFKQNPRSLAERFVYEYINVMDQGTQAVYYNRDPTNFNIRTLVIDSKTTKSLNIKLSKYLETIQKHRELNKYSAIAHILEVEVNASKNIISQITDLVIQKFQEFSKTENVFNLLLIVFSYTSSDEISDLDRDLQKKAENSTDIKYYRHLADIDNEQIVTWFSENGATNSEQINIYIEQFLNTLGNSKTRHAFNNSRRLDMNVMEAVQRQVFKFAMKEDDKKEGHEDV